MNVKTEDVVVMTTDISNDADVKILGVIFATACYTKSLGHDIMANLKNWTVGGNLHAYDEMMEQSVAIAVGKLRQKAAELGANAIYGFRIATPSIAAGAAEVIAYGTAAIKESNCGRT